MPSACWVTFLVIIIMNWINVMDAIKCCGCFGTGDKSDTYRVKSLETRIIRVKHHESTRMHVVQWMSESDWSMDTKLRNVSRDRNSVKRSSNSDIELREGTFLHSILSGLTIFNQSKYFTWYIAWSAGKNLTDIC